MCKGTVLPSFDHNFNTFTKFWITIFWWYTKSLMFLGIKTSTSTPVDPTVRQLIKERHLFGQAKGVVKWCQRNARANTKVLGVCCKMRTHNVYRRTDAVGTKVMLCQPDRVVTGPVHQLYPVECAFIYLFQRNSPTRPSKELQNSKFHGAPIQLRQRSR